MRMILAIIVQTLSRGLLLHVCFTLLFDLSMMEKECDNTDNKGDDTDRRDFNARYDPVEDQNRTQDNTDDI